MREIGEVEDRMKEKVFVDEHRYFKRLKNNNFNKRMDINS